MRDGGRLLALIGTLLLLLLMPGGLPAQQGEDPRADSADVSGGERVRWFESALRLQADGSLEVRERITVWAQGREIVRGIYRDIATQSFDPWVGVVQLRLEILSATLGGQPIRHNVEAQADYTRIMLGEPERPLAPGQHEFELRYRLHDALEFSAAGSRLYWNVTGNGWSLPIDSAAVELEVDPDLLDGLAPEQIDFKAYTGVLGSTASDVERSIRDRSIGVRSRSTLPPGSGLSIDVALPGRPVGAAATLWQRLSLGHRVGLLACALLWLYFLLAWLKVGRDPAPGRELLVRRLPAGQTPAGLRLVAQMRHDPRCFVADLLQLAIEGRLRLQEVHGQLQAERLDSAEGLPAPLQRLHQRLFEDREQVMLARSERSRLLATVAAHRKALQLANEGIHFRSNLRWWLPGLPLALVAILGQAALLGGGAENRALALFMTLWLSGWSVGVYVLLSQVLLQWRSARSWGHRLGALGITAFSLPFVVGELVGLAVYGSVAGAAGLLVLLLCLLALIGFHHWLKAPTAAGRLLLDQVDSLRQWLDRGEVAAEGLEGAERLLPVAFALDRGEAFGERLQQQFGAALEDPAGRSWFRPALAGSGLGVASWQILGSELGNQLQSSISRATMSQSGSRGGRGGGGGGAGGGRGGRGGGGW